MGRGKKSHKNVTVDSDSGQYGVLENQKEDYLEDVYMSFVANFPFLLVSGKGVNTRLNIVIGGDLVPVRRSKKYFKSGDAVKIFNDLLFEFEEADLSIVNLECPLINKSTPIVKNGPVLGVENACINGIKQANIDVLNLANNHILDHGSEGLENTLKVCSDAGVLTVGAGKNLEDARQILIKKVGNIKVGILAVAEHEFSIATKDTWGANPLDLIDYVRNIKSQRSKFDFLIVLLHGGNEGYQYPSPRLKDTCRFMVEMGANAVIVQHTHCPGCYEEYQNGHIIYGQGNLIFDSPSEDKNWFEGFLVKLSIAENLTSTVDVIPYIQSGMQTGAKKMDKEKAKLFLQGLKERSNAIKDEAFIKNQWYMFCQKRKYACLSNVLGLNRLLTKILFKTNGIGLFIKCFYSENSILRLKNTVQCESHREILETIL